MPSSDARELILEPALPIIDPHHHLWPQSEGVARYMPGEFLADATAGHNVIASVFVECHSHYRTSGAEALRCVGETEFVERVAREHAAGPGPRLCASMVAHANLLLGAEVRSVLEAHVAASRRVRSIRHATAWDEDPQLNFPVLNASPGMMSDARFRAGFAQLHACGLHYDAWLYHTQLGELEALARAFPQTTIVLDHIGTPLAVGRFATRKAEVLNDWTAAMRRLAGCPNVIVKLGGLGMAFCAPEWLNGAGGATSERIAASTRDYYLRTIDLFTPARCMFESNFPVDQHAVSYDALWNSFKRISAHFSPSERMQLFSGTAARIYSIEIQ